MASKIYEDFQRGLSPSGRSLTVKEGVFNYDNFAVSMSTISHAHREAFRQLTVMEDELGGMRAVMTVDRLLTPALSQGMVNLRSRIHDLKRMLNEMEKLEAQIFRTGDEVF